MSSQTVFVDTNVILDWLGKREPFYPFAEAVFVKAERREIQLMVSSLSIATTHYILRKQLGIAETRKALAVILSVVKVCSVGFDEITFSLSSGISDFEDAIQYQTAMRNNTKVILTRNVKDFAGAAVPVMTAEAFLQGAS